MNPFAEAFEAAKTHARSSYPSESVGVVCDGIYVPLRNAAAPAEEHIEDDKNCPCQLCAFAVADDEYLNITTGRRVDMLIHSHPNGPLFPSEIDMAQQIAMDIPWGVVATDGERCSEPAVWGTKDIEPMIGREFMHGVSDCYSIIRDAFRLGKDALSEQDIDGWPYEPIELPEVPRGDGWWDQDGKDLYTDLFGKFGFKKIDASEARPGDVFLGSIHSKKLNHGGILVGNDLILHHIPQRLSRREPAGLWGRSADLWIRYDA